MVKYLSASYLGSSSGVSEAGTYSELVRPDSTTEWSYICWCSKEMHQLSDRAKIPILQEDQSDASVLSNPESWHAQSNDDSIFNSFGLRRKHRASFHQSDSNFKIWRYFWSKEDQIQVNIGKWRYRLLGRHRYTNGIAQLDPNCLRRAVLLDRRCRFWWRS